MFLWFNCILLEVMFDGINFDEGIGFSFEWSLVDISNFVSGINILMFIVNVLGFYQFEIENDSIGCI